MSDGSDKSWVGFGTTPKQAVLYHIPDPNDVNVGAILGLSRIPDSSEPESYGPQTYHEISIYFSDRKAKMWKVAVDSTDNGLEAFVCSGK